MKNQNPSRMTISERLASYQSDEQTEGTGKPPVKVDPTVETAPEPVMKTDQQMNEPLEQEVLDMKADETITAQDEEIREMAKMGWEGVDGPKAKAIWEGLTQGAEHKIQACMTQVQGKVDDPGAFCGSLAKTVGYEAG